MSRKALVWLFLSVGSIVGSFIPSLWGASVFSFSSIIFSALGAFAGIWLGWRLGE